MHATEYKVAKKELKRAIKNSKDICENLNNDVWGKAYQIVAKPLGEVAPEAPKSPSKMNIVIAELFPSHLKRKKREYNVKHEVSPFEALELQDVAKSLKPGKALGPDGILTSVIKLIAQEFPYMLLNLFNVCLATGTFPPIWKRQRLVLLDKGKRPPITPSSYRPLCMLDVAGKLLEKLVQARLRKAIERAGGLAESQHGFRKGRSTIGAIREVINIVTKAWLGNLRSRQVGIVLTLDVRNAFNSANWDNILDALEC